MRRESTPARDSDVIPVGQAAAGEGEEKKRKGKKRKEKTREDPFE